MFWYSRLLYQSFFLSIHDTDENRGAASSSRSCVLVAVVNASLFMILAMMVISEILIAPATISGHLQRVPDAGLQDKA